MEVAQLIKNLVLLFTFRVMDLLVQDMIGVRDGVESLLELFDIE